MLAVNGLTPRGDEGNAGLTASFHTPFFGFVDYKGHSRFVLRISILLSHVSLYHIPIFLYDGGARTLMLGLRLDSGGTTQNGKPGKHCATSERDSSLRSY